MVAEGQTAPQYTDLGRRAFVMEASRRMWHPYRGEDAGRPDRFLTAPLRAGDTCNGKTHCPSHPRPKHPIPALPNVFRSCTA